MEKAWQVHAWGEPESMVLAEVETPKPGPKQVLIRTRAAALNFFDILQVQGKYQVKPPFPFTPGAEASGVVEAVGEGVTAFAPGDRVLAMTNGGAFSTACLAETSRTFKLPESMSFAQGAAMPIVYHTSWFALAHRALIQPGEWLLVHAGASGVGMSAIQIGAALGAPVIATAGSSSKCDFARRQGAAHALNYTDPSWVDEVKRITGGRGADVIYDPVGGEVFDLSSKCIAPEGRLLVIGFASGVIPSFPANRALLKNMSLVGVFWGGFVQAHPAFVAETQAALEGLFHEKKIDPYVGSQYSLADAPKGLRDLADRKVLGKAVLLMD
jgi:NADPH2:quinone reductase